jgi:putative phosphotransacetylase
MSVDRERIAQIAAQVVEELRSMGLAPGPDRPAPYTAAKIRSYGPPAQLAKSPANGARAGGALRPEEPGLSPEGRPTVTCNVSNRHIHLTREDCATLFGEDVELTPRSYLMQPYQFASEQTVSLIAGRGRTIQNVRILGPLRKYTQVEISRTDGFFLGINPPIRASGDIQGSAGGTLVGPKGTLVLKEGIIVADRHIHTPPDVAAQFGLVDNQLIQVRVGHTDKPTILDRVRIRISDEFLFEMHIDNDDANSAWVMSGDRLDLLI